MHTTMAMLTWEHGAIRRSHADIRCHKRLWNELVSSVHVGPAVTQSERVPHDPVDFDLLGFVLGWESFIDVGMRVS